MKIRQGECPRIRVAVVEQGAGSMPSWQTIEIDSTIVFTMEDLDDYRTKNWDNRVYDVMVLIAAVEFCDKSCKRPAWGWMRRIELHLPVHDVDHWETSQVGSALMSALKFLTGDEWQITFYKRRSPMEDIGRQSRLEFGNPSKVVTPFSDGLDSRAVTAMMTAGGRSDRLIRVRVGAKTDDRPRTEHRKAPFLTIPFKVKSGDRPFAESTVRSRGFKFTLLSGIAAYLLGTHDIVMPESGQGALGPSLVQTSHGYEDYRNHPLFFGRMERLVAAIFNYPVSYRLPRLWKTKGQTLGEFAALPVNPDEWVKTRSCWQQNRNSSVDGKRRQCGICAACMLRRLSFHAAGLEEPKENYIWEDLRAGEFAKGAAPGFNKITGAMEHYAIAGTLHLDHLADLRSSPVHRKRVARHAWFLSQELGMTPAEGEDDLLGLLQQHEVEWKAFMKDLGPKSFVAQWLV